MEKKKESQLNLIIERIVSSGRLSREDQSAINSEACSRRIDDAENAAVRKLMDLIIAGEIEVC